MGVSILVVMFLIAAVPAVYYLLPREIDRWHRALAIERQLEGDLEGAIRSLSRVIASSPDNDEHLLLRAKWQLKIRKLDAALEDATRAIELAPGNAQAYLVRSMIYQHLGRHAEALEDWNTLADRLTRPGGIPSVYTLNGRAYARAVAGVELDEALAEIEQALERLPHDAAMLDTRGFIHYLRGDLDSALADLGRAVPQVELTYNRMMMTLKTRGAGVLDLRQFKIQVEEYAENVAVIRYHRALVYDALHDADKAEEDRRRVRALGFEPNEGLF